VSSMYVLNLCCAKLPISILAFLGALLFIIETDEISAVTKEIHYHFFIIKFSLHLTVIFLTMVFIIINKTLEIKMNLRYTAFWDEKKTAVLVTNIWICGTCSFIFTTCAYHLHGFRFEHVYPSFIHLPASIIYVILRGRLHERIFKSKLELHI
jgi:hypothetical protein